MGVYVIQHQTGTSVCISYTPRGEERVRKPVEFVENGPAFGKRLADAKRRAKDKLTQRKAEIIEGRHMRPRTCRRITFREYVRETYIPLLRRSSMKERSRECEVHRGSARHAIRTSPTLSARSKRSENTCTEVN